MSQLIDNKNDVFYDIDEELSTVKKVCSFLPSVTHIINVLGLEDRLVGVTFDCPSDKPKVVHSKLEGLDLSLAEISEKMAWHQANQIPVNTIDTELLAKLSPDVIFTQELCDVCQIGEDDVCKALEVTGMEVALYSLNPVSFGDVEDTILFVSEVLGEAERGKALLADLRAGIKPIINQLLKGKAELKEVLFLEWLDPVFCAGHWITDQIMMAGGVDRLSNPHDKSEELSAAQLQDYNPEVIVISLCGVHFKDSNSKVNRETLHQLLKHSKAWQNKQVYLADSNLFTQAATELFHGVALLAALFYPEEFSIPESLKSRVLQLA